MRIGILGSGLMGGKLGTLFARAGHDVIFSYSRSRQKLERLARDAGRKARAGTPREAAQEADALLLAVHWSRVDDVLKQAGNVSGKLLVSCSLPMNADDTELVVAHTSSGAEKLAKKARGARVVAAFGTVPSEVLFSVFERRRNRTRPSLVYCGDDGRGKRVTAQLIRDVGFDPIDGAAADRAVHGAFHAAHRAAGVRRKGRSRAGVPLRAVLEVESGRRSRACLSRAASPARSVRVAHSRLLVRRQRRYAANRGRPGRPLAASRFMRCVRVITSAMM